MKLTVLFGRNRSLRKALKNLVISDVFGGCIYMTNKKSHGYISNKTTTHYPNWWYRRVKAHGLISYPKQPSQLFLSLIVELDDGNAEHSFRGTKKEA